MPNTIAEMVISMRAETVQMRADLQKLSQEVQGQGRQMQRHLSSIEGAANKVSTGFREMRHAIYDVLAIREIYRFTADLIDTQDAAAKMAKQVGVAVDELTSLQYAADRSGVGVDTMRLAIVALEQRIADAQRGKGRAKDIFAILGLDPQTFGREGVIDQLKILSSALNQVQDSTQRVGFAAKLFGQSGTAMLQLLHEGPEGMQKLIDRARELGITLGEKDAKAAEAAKDAMTDLKASMEGLTRALVDPGLEPSARYLNDIADAIANIRKAVQAGGKEGSSWLTAFVNALRDISLFDPKIGAGLKHLSEGLPGAKPPNPLAYHPFQVHGPQTPPGGPGDGATVHIPPAWASSEQYKALRKDLEGENTALAANAKAMDVARTAAMGTAEARERLLKVIEATRQSMAGEPASNGPFGGPAGLEHVKEMEQHARELAALQDQIYSGGESLRDAYRADADAARQTAQEWQTAYDQAKANTQTFAATVSGGFASAITGAQTFTQALRNVVQQLLQMNIQAAGTQWITKLFGYAPGPFTGPMPTPASSVTVPGMRATAAPSQRESRVVAVQSVRDAQRRGLMR